MPAIDLHAPVLGPPGQPCAACGEPLAADQRYCLSCGERRGPPRLDPLAHARGARDGRGAAAGAAGRRRRAPATRVAAALAARGRRRHPADARLRDRGRRGGRTARRARRSPRPARRATIVVGRRPPTAAPARSPLRADAPRRPGPAHRPTPRTRSTATPTADTSAPDALGAGHLDARQPRRRTRPPRQLDPGSPSPTPASTPAPATRRHDARTGDLQARLDRRPHRPHDGRGARRPLPHAVPGGDAAPEGAAALGLQAGPARRRWPTSSRWSAASGRPPQQRGNCPAYVDVDLQARTGCVFAKDVETLPGQLTAAGKTWRAYVEDSDAAQPPDTCRHPAPGGALEPVMARNPYLFFHAIVDSPDCAANTAGTSRLVPDTEDAESAPTLSLVIPNACHDGADQPCADGRPGGPGRGRRVAEGAARPAAGLQGLQGRRPGPADLRHRAGRDQAGRRPADLRRRGGRRHRRRRLSPRQPAAHARGRLHARPARPGRRTSTPFRSQSLHGEATPS